MKRSLDELNLQNAFPPQSDACHAALMRAARSVSEERPAKRLTLRVVLAAAAMLAATMAVAAAAGHLLGWTDYFGSQSRVPETAQRAMSREENRHEFTLGPVRFATQELLCDGHLAMASTRISMADGSDALICAEPFDAIGAIGENGVQAAQRLGVPPQTTWLEAARALNRRLYAVRACLEPPADADGGTGMEDMLWNEDGSAVYFSMPLLHGAPHGGAMEMQLFLRVAEYDVQTEDEVLVLTDRQTLRIALEAPIAELAYAFQDGFCADGYALESVHAVLTSAGLYLDTAFTAPVGDDGEAVLSRPFPQWLNENGEPLPTGVSLTASVDTSALPRVVYTQMLAADAAPERMILRMPASSGGTQAADCALRLSR